MVVPLACALLFYRPGFRTVRGIMGVALVLAAAVAVSFLIAFAMWAVDPSVNRGYGREMSPSPAIEATSQSLVRSFCAAPHVNR